MLNLKHETKREKFNCRFLEEREEIQNDRSSVKAFGFTSQKFSG